MDVESWFVVEDVLFLTVAGAGGLGKVESGRM